MFRSCIDSISKNLAFHPPRPSSYSLVAGDKGFYSFGDGWQPQIRNPLALRQNVSVHLLK